MSHGPRSILRVDATLRWAEIDEDESESVALACLEWIFAETNTYYKQYVFNTVAVGSVAKILRDNVLDTILAATLTSEHCLSTERFVPEEQPTAELRDRHAARSVPQKSPAKPTLATSSAKTAAAAVIAAVASASHPSVKTGIKIPKVMAEKTPARVRRRRRIEKESSSKDILAPVLPQLLESAIDIPPDKEALEAKLWRAACLKELESSKKKPGFTKWGNVARAFIHSGQDNSPTQPDVTLGAQPPSSNQGLGAIKLKSNVDSFSGINNVIRHSPILSLEDENESATPMTTSSSLSKPASSRTKSKARSAAKKQSSTIQLNDTLSRKIRPATTHLSPPPSQSFLSPSSSNNNLNNGPTGLWKFDRHTSSSSSIGTTAVVSSANVIPTDELALDIALLANSPSGIVSGVTLARGDSVIEGPERVESPSNMSRKRFDLHQRLTMDYILNGSEALDSIDQASTSAAKSLTSPTPNRSSDWKLTKNYVEEPADPVILPPSPDPLLPDALAIPRTHLATSRSVPALRVRTPNNLPTVVGGGAGASHVMNEDADRSISKIRQRPSTAMVDHARIKGSGLASRSSEYMREFPKPPSGVVIRARNAVQASVDDTLRVAWSR